MIILSPFVFRVYAGVVGAAVAGVFGFLCLIIPHMRCCICLLLPLLASNAGNSLIKATIVNAVLTGPMENVINNGLIFAGSLACSANLTVMQAKESAQATYSMMETQLVRFVVSLF